MSAQAEQMRAFVDDEVLVGVGGNAEKVATGESAPEAPEAEQAVLRPTTHVKQLDPEQIIPLEDKDF